MIDWTSMYHVSTKNTDNYITTSHDPSSDPSSDPGLKKTQKHPKSIIVLNWHIPYQCEAHTITLASQLCPTGPRIVRPDTGFKCVRGETVAFLCLRALGHKGLPLHVLCWSSARTQGLCFLYCGGGVTKTLIVHEGNFLSLKSTSCLRKPRHQINPARTSEGTYCLANGRGRMCVALWTTQIG